VTGRFPDLASLWLALAVLALPFALPTVTLASEALVFATGTLSCALLLGGAGLLSFGQGLFLGAGAYASGLLLRDAGFGTVAAVALGTLGAAALAGLVGFISVRRRGVYFVMLTLAFAQMGYFAVLAASRVTGGENGLTGVPRPPLPGGVALGTPGAVYAVLAVLCLAAFFLAQRALASPFGSVLAAIRENEARAEALGYDVRAFKVAAFALAGGIAGLAGAMHTLFLGFVPPNTVQLEMSERLVVMAIIGRAGSPAGAFVGTLFYVVAAEVLTELWPRWLILIALLLIAIVLFLPRGIWGTAQGLLARRRDAAADA
jgi:branched-chain amino acid transport system permease protein